MSPAPRAPYIKSQGEQYSGFFLPKNQMAKAATMIEIIKAKLAYILISFVSFTSLTLSCPGPVFAYTLAPAEVAVVANQNSADGMQLARYYMAKRSIPVENLIKLRTTTSEQVSRREFDESIARPIRAYLHESGRRIKCLVLVFGLPLKVLPPALNFKEKAKLDYLQAEKKALAESSKGGSPESRQKFRQKIIPLNAKIKKISKVNQEASVDSELSLVRIEKHQLSGWLPNPLFLGFKGRKLPYLPKELIMLVSRLDGPTPRIVKRVIDDSSRVEKIGLDGTAYLDARWPKPPKGKKLSGYAFYDMSLHRTADILRKAMPVVLDERQGLFPGGADLPAALYCGWYSLGRYVDAFSWLPGSVGYHIASSECSTLKRAGSRVWCKVMLEKGIAATLGPVSEPYVQAFPVPEVFFGLLSSGKFNLVESYILSLPYLSWKMVLLGDPLYSPYLKKRKGNN